MNTVDAQVLKVLSKPYFKYKHWFIDVRYVDMGGEGVTELLFSTKIEAESVQEGYKFQH